MGQRGHLGGHLEPSWRIFWELGDVLGVLWVVWGREIGVRQSWKILPGGRRDAPEAQGEFFWKRDKDKYTIGLQIACHLKSEIGERKYDMIPNRKA